ncbi:MAG: RNA methyltransferase [Parvibaculales bacterium]
MDKISSEITPPAIILVGAQLGENIGTVARAMLNFGLTDLRLVNPRPGWQMERARKAASGAESLIDNHRLFDSVPAATADIGYLVATTARLRDMVKPVLTPRRVAEEMRAWVELSNAAGQVPGGILFGPERTGLTNEDISLADAICRVPLNPEFSSLNLAQAVLLLGYEWFQLGDDTAARSSPMPDTRPATRGEIHAMFAHFEAALDGAGFLAPPEKKPAMARNLRNMFHRAGLTEQDVRTFRGVINALLRWPRGAADAALKPRVAAMSRGLPDPGAGASPEPIDPNNKPSD